LTSPDRFCLRSPEWEPCRRQLGVLPGSFMSGQIQWAAYGGIAVAAGISILVALRRIGDGYGGTYLYWRDNRGCNLYGWRTARTSADERMTDDRLTRHFLNFSW